MLWDGDSKKGEVFCDYSALPEKRDFPLHGGLTSGSNEQAEGGHRNERKASLAALLAWSAGGTCHSFI